MEPAVSNIALPAYAHLDALPALSAIGYTGLEVAPSRVWQDTWHGLTNAQVKSYRHACETAGLRVVGLHSLVFDHPELQLFGEPASVTETANFMEHLSGVCRDLGGRTLVWGGGRKRGAIPADEATTRAIDFMIDLCERTRDHGTVFCFEPLGPSGSDFVNGVLEAKAIVDAVARDNLKIQIDAKALVENDEVLPEIFEAVKNELVHVHANEPGLAVVGSSGEVDHASIGRMLADIGYNGSVSAEQRMFSEEAYMDDVRQSFNELSRHYHG
ncbi:MAG: sugar phosphate isomerase/epimerase [Rhodospirillales bacterium]|nr:sugar phosphate isomerase/epimerase [Rhodospirillales bacterium]MBO6787714.1 sugar phosphate isomerase/epimerase [Rhodospirillales bacterium]